MTQTCERKISRDPAALLVGAFMTTVSALSVGHALASEPSVIGEMIIDGESHELTQSYWCEPEAGYESGTTVAIVAAYDESGDVIVYGQRRDHEGSESSEALITAATDPNTNYSSEGLGGDPMLVMENGAVRLQGGVYRPGQDPVEIEAQFSLPDEPGFPGYC